MIRCDTQIVAAECDVCKRSLLQEIGGGRQNANYGLLRSSFGYGSKLDDQGIKADYHLCEVCWVKALSAVGLSPE